MARHPRQLAESGIYHVMMRGTNRDAIFLEDEDFQQFLKALVETKQASGCLVLAYCLMTNHVHLVLRTGTEPIGVVIKRLGVRYAGWFNRKYSHVGHVFQDRFRSRPVENDAYLVTLLPYIWNNPVAAGMTPRPEAYEWSSRRLLDHPTTLVDDAALRELLAIDPIELATAHVPTEDETVAKLDRPHHNLESAADLLRRMCGATCPEEFDDLGAVTQQRVVRELRTRSLSYALIGRLIGRSRHRVQRMHVAADGHRG